MAKELFYRINVLIKKISFKFITIYTVLCLLIIGSVISINKSLIKMEKDLYVDGADFSVLFNLFGGVINFITILFQVLFISVFSIGITLLFNILFTRYILKSNNYINIEYILKIIKQTIVIETVISLVLCIITFNLPSGIIIFILTCLYLPLITYLYLYKKVYKKLKD